MTSWRCTKPPFAKAYNSITIACRIHITFIELELKICIPCTNKGSEFVQPRQVITGRTFSSTVNQDRFVYPHTLKGGYLDFFSHLTELRNITRISLKFI